MCVWCFVAVKNRSEWQKLAKKELLVGFYQILYLVQ